MVERPTVPAGDTASASRGVLPELTRRPDPHTVSSAEEFATALTALREQAGVPIRELAKLVGATSGTLTGWFAGHQLPPASALPVLEQVLQACGVPSESGRQAWLDALSRVRRLPGRRPEDAPAPYRGLDSYGPADAPYFFGREVLVARLVALATSSTSAGPTVLVGPSGSGKTSALHAGLAARLQTAGNWEVVTFVPGARPLDALNRALAEVRQMKLPPGSRVAVIIDQFEEVFTACADEKDRADFIRAVTSPLHPGPGIGPAVTVVIGLRADFYAAALRYDALSRALQDRQVLAGPLSKDDLRRAISEPARAAGVLVDAGLVELILRDLTTVADGAEGPRGSGQVADALPRMSYALLESWRRCMGRRMTVEDYMAVGGLQGSIAKAAEATYDRLGASLFGAAQHLFLRLVQVSDDAPDTRRRATAVDLGLDTPAGENLTPVLERFVAAGMITTHDDSVEITHEALLTAWPRLSQWLDAERSGLIARRELAEAAGAWNREARDPRLLYRGPRLAAARQWAAATGVPRPWSGLEQAFFDASVAATTRVERSERIRARRTRVGVAAATVVALTASAAAGIGAVQRSGVRTERDQAVAHQLADTAARLQRTDPALAAQFAAASWATAATPQSRSALLEAAGGSLDLRLAGPAGSAAVAVSGDGRLMAAAGDRGGLRLWKLDQDGTLGATQTASLPAIDDQQLYTVALSHDGRLLLAAGTAGKIHRWSLADPAEPTRLPDVAVSSDAVFTLALSADGRTVAATGAEGRVWLYDVNGTELPAVTAPFGPGKATALQSITFSKDGRALAAGSSGGKVWLWTLADRTKPVLVPVQLAGPSGAVTSVAFSPDGRRLLAGSRDQRAYLWQLSSPTAAAVRVDQATGPVNAVAFAPDGAHWVTGSSDRRLRVYDTATRTLNAELTQPEPITELAFTPTGSGLVTGSSDGFLRVWDSPTSGAALPPGPIGAVAYLDDHRLTAASTKDALRVFDVGDGGTLRPAGPAATAGGPSSITLNGTMATNRTGTLIVAGASDGTIRLFAPGDGGQGTIRPLSTLPATQRRPIAAVAVSPEGTLLATVTPDGSVQLVDASAVASPRPVGAPFTVHGLTRAVAFSPDGRLLAVGGSDQDGVTLWDVSDPARPRSVGRLGTSTPAQLTAIVFAPDGKLAAVGTAHGDVRLMDTSEDTKPRWIGRPLTGTEGTVSSVAIAADGHSLAVAGADGLVRLWDLTDVEKPGVVAALSDPDNTPIGALAFDPAGGRVAAGTSDGTVLQWSMDTTAALTRICTLTGAGISEPEWERYAPEVDYRLGCPQ